MAEQPIKVTEYFNYSVNEQRRTNDILERMANGVERIAEHLEKVLTHYEDFELKENENTGENRIEPVKNWYYYSQKWKEEMDDGFYNNVACHMCTPNRDGHLYKNCGYAKATYIQEHLRRDHVYSFTDIQ